MKFAPDKDSVKSTEDQLRLQPFTLLATIPVILVFTAVITYACVFSESLSETAIRGFISGIVALPVVALFAIIVKKEETISLASRRVAWRIMLFGYLAVIVSMLLLFFTTDRPGIGRYHLITCILMSLPIAHALFYLNRSAKKNG